MARTVNVAEHAARRDAILDAAQRLILSNGYERLTIQDILEDLEISKGAFYHYFDSKPAVVEALTERLVDDSERALARIAEDAELGAAERLQLFFGEIIRWKSERQNLMVAMLPVWYAPDNLAFRLLVDRATAKRLAPLLSLIVRQGVDEHHFATAYPEQAGAIIVAVVVGGLEVLNLIGDQLGLSDGGGFWGAIGAINDNFGALGYGIVALFIASWGISMIVYRFKRYDHQKSSV